MARKNNTDELLHCNVCGEDYSPTYRRCPFCGERAGVRSVDEDDIDDGYVFDGQALFDDEPSGDQNAAAKGGKRLAAGGKGSAPAKKAKASHYDPPSAINWVRLITFGISLVIIIAALIIVFTVVYPMIHNPDNPGSPTPPGTSEVSPSPDTTDDPSPSPVVTDDPSPSPGVTDEPIEPGVAAYISGAAGGLNVRSGPGTTYEIQDSLVNGNEVTILEVAEGGWYKISYSGKNGQATIGYVKSDYVTAASGSDEPTSPPASDPGTTSGELTPGAKGKITGAASGLRVRSGPGTTYDIQASLMNGNEITILEDAGNGWYKIAYSGANGQATTGYIMGDFIHVD